MDKVIRVIVKEPGKPATDELVRNTLETFQKLVGGYIETFSIWSDAVVICNEEGRLIGLPENCEVCGVSFCGTIVVAGVRGDEFTDVPIRAQMANEIRLLKEIE